MEPVAAMMIRDTIVRLRDGVVRTYGRLNTPQKFFLPLFFVAGLVFVFAVPPFQNPDEPMHFYRGYQVAKGQVFSTSNGAELYGGDIPLSMRELVVKSEIGHNYDYDYRFFLDYGELLRYGYGGEKVFEGFPNTAIYSPLAYIPSALAHGVVGLFNGPLLVALYLGRLLSMLMVLLAFMLALQVIPFGKWIVFAVGLIPMTVASASGINADGMTLSMSLLFIAITFFITFRKKAVSKWWFGLLFGLMASLALVKQAHIALLPLALLIPILNSRYRKKEVYISMAGAFIIALAVFMVWFKATDQIVINFVPSIQPDLQKAFIFQAPTGFIKALLSTYLTNYGNGTFIGLFGNFGWLTATLPTLFIVISTLVLYFAVQAREKDEQRLTSLPVKQVRFFRVWCVAVFMAVLLMISAALYVYWTPYKEKFIMGIQGRYFLPILPLLLIPFIGKLKPGQQSIKRIVVIGSCVVLLSAIYTIFWRFYIIP